jgi:RND family efflux transporter MFP subunit
MGWTTTGKHFVAALLGLSILVACAEPVGQPGGATAAVEPVPTVEPVPPGPARSERFLGVVLASETVEIGAPFDGRLARIDVQPGDLVKAGTVMGSMALESLRSEERMEQALLEQAEARRNQAELEAREATERFQRYRKSPPGALSADEFSAAQYQEKIALAQVAAARANIQERRAALARIRQQISEAELRVPFDCVVAVRYLDPGAWVQAGMPVLRVIRAGGLQVRFALPENRSGMVAAGLPVSIFLPALGKEFPGKIESIAPEVDTASRMVFAMATLLSPSDNVRAGMAARVSLGDTLSSSSPPADGGQPARRNNE